MLTLALAGWLCCQAQSLSRLARRAQQKVERAVETQIDRAVDNTVNTAVGSAANGNFNLTGSKTVTFDKLPTTLDELLALPQASLSDPYEVAALCMAILCNYESNPSATWEMLDHIIRPNSLADEKSKSDMHGFVQQRLRDGKGYKVRAFFNGATVENNYTPDEPYKIKVSANKTSFQEKGRARLMLKSAGADSPGPIWLRKTKDGKWFVTQISCLTDIRLPGAQTDWE